jgi:4-diphosphocytidyl-2-C-methyl-D-erythritol kinase
MIFLAPAKINLSLRITGKDKKDGYHFISSVFDPVSLYDILDIKPLADPVIRVTDPLGKLKIRPEKNLAHKAAVLLQRTSKTRLGADIRLYKRIPDGAGLGGGSSDAAAVLKALNRLWKLDYGEGRLKKLAFKLGSDVPFFIGAKRGLITGKGEKIRPFPKGRVFWYVIIVKKGVKVPTRDAYEWYDSDFKLTLGIKKYILGSKLVRGMQNPSSALHLHNDFEGPVFKRRKALKKVRETLLKCRNAAGACMSGSGSSVFALFTKKKDAQACYKKSMKAFKGSFICIAHSI